MRRTKSSNMQRKDFYVGSFGYLDGRERHSSWDSDEDSLSSYVHRKRSRLSDADDFGESNADKDSLMNDSMGEASSFKVLSSHDTRYSNGSLVSDGLAF